MPQNRATNRASDSKSTQRTRLLAGMLATVNADGYIRATIADVIARAGVSRPTFYEYFAGKDDCFLALYRRISRPLLEQIAHAVSDSPPERALQVVVRQLSEHAEAEPAQAQLMASDALAGGRHARDERRHLMSHISNSVEAARAIASPQSPSPDLPTQTVIGATHWLISQRLRQGGRNLAQLTHDLTNWLQHYDHPISKHRWSALDPRLRPEASRYLPELTNQLPATALSSPLPSERAQSQRWRILLATAESAIQTGYVASTVTAISNRARLDRHVFYDHFRDKHQAFLAIHELAFQQSKDIGARGFFSAQAWPERVWRCLLATSEFHAAHPTIAHVACVETHALGLPAIQRVEESREAFTTLLRADSQHTSPLPDITAAEAIGAAIFEMAYDQISHDRAKDLPRYAYHATYLCLAPFLGVQTANRFVDAKLNDAHSPAATKRRRRR